MSVILYRNDGKAKTLAADSLCVKGDVVYSSPDKLLKLNDNQFVGGVGNADFCEYVKICLKDTLQKDETVITLRKKISPTRPRIRKALMPFISLSCRKQ